MDKEILRIDDPRDAFALMLLERIDALEGHVQDLIGRLDNVTARTEKEQVFHVDKSNNFSCYGFVSPSFFMRAIKPETMSVDDFKGNLVQVANLVKERIGCDKFVTMTLVVGTRDGHSIIGDIYINLKDVCFIYQIYKMLSQIQYPLRVNLRWDNMVDVYLMHVNHGGLGECYSMFDVSGNKVDEPGWTTWINSIQLYLGRGPEPQQ